MSYRVCFDWGWDGARTLVGPGATVVVVDVLSFTTTLSVALDRGIEVFPYRWRDDSAQAFADRHDAQLALGRSVPGGLSLSPVSFRAVPRALARVGQPSPNGGTIAAECGVTGLACVGASLRNASAVAAWLSAGGAAGVASTVSAEIGPLSAAAAVPSAEGAAGVLSTVSAAAGSPDSGAELSAEVLVADKASTPASRSAGVSAVTGMSSEASIVVIAAGERWPSGALRPAIEAMWGAGAVISELARLGWRDLSPEADAARAAYEAVRGREARSLLHCASGRELVGLGHRADVEIAAEIGTSGLVPVLRGASFTASPQPNA